MPDPGFARIDATITRVLIDGMLSYPDLPDTVWATKVAEAVRDELLAEGRIEDYDDYHALVIPLGRDDE